MFADASKRRFDLVLFWSLDRLSREGVLETLQHLNRLTSYGVAYKSFTEQYFDSCGVFKDAVIAIMATVAKQERVKRSKRTKAGLARVRAEGRTLGRPRLELQSAQIARLRAQGLSLRAIGRQFGVSEGSIRRMLSVLRNKRSLKHPAKCFQSGADFHCADCVGKVRYLRTEPAFLPSAILFFEFALTGRSAKQQLDPRLRREGTEDDMGAASHGGVDAKHFRGRKQSPEVAK